MWGGSLRGLEKYYLETAFTIPLLPSSRVPWVLPAVLASLVLPGPRYVPCPFSHVLADCPLDGPPALLRGVSQPHPPLLSVEAGKGQAFHSPRWHDTELGVQLQVEIGGKQKMMGRHGRSGREQKTRTQRGEGKAQQTLEPGGSWRTWARRWL